MNENNARIFIVSAPSGCGKGTLIARLSREFEIYNSVSCTTRKPRDGDEDGVDYFFMSREEFLKLKAEDGFLESAVFDGNYYGTPRKAVEEKLESATDVLLEIEPKGAFQVKSRRPDAVTIFILPPSIESLGRRLRRRAEKSGETEDQIKARLATARGDIEQAHRYDYVMVNGDLDKAVKDLKKIFVNSKTGKEDLTEFLAVNQRNIIEEVLKNA